MALDDPPPHFGSLYFSTAQVRAQDRVEAWRDVLSRKLFKVEVKSLSERPFRADARLRIFEGLRFGDGGFDASVHRRSASTCASDGGDLVIVHNRSNTLTIQQRHREIVLREGDACIVDCDKPVSFTRDEPGSIRFIRFPGAVLSRPLPVEDHGARVIAQGTALKLLMQYLDVINRQPFYPSKDLRGRIVAHVYELVDLAINGPDSGDGDVVRPGGPKAAQLNAIKDYIARNFSDRDLTIESVAARHGLSTRSLQRKLESDGGTFSGYVLALRLAAAHLQLLDPEQAGRSISAIALDCGFADMSHFNHSFRRRFGGAPSDIRREAGIG